LLYATFGNQRIALGSPPSAKPNGDQKHGRGGEREGEGWAQPNDIMKRRLRNRVRLGGLVTAGSGGSQDACTQIGRRWGRSNGESEQARRFRQIAKFRVIAGMACGQVANGGLAFIQWEGVDREGAGKLIDFLARHCQLLRIHAAVVT
jgi:hypothetical protein